jgi:hypothetical protein
LVVLVCFAAITVLVLSVALRFPSAPIPQPVQTGTLCCGAVMRLLTTSALISGALLALPATGALTAQTAAPQAALRIVVIEGEDAVNIIQQKTAVAPVVEIRDRNDLPVSGATVTFAIGGKNATFAGGVQTLTVTTNAAGRAVVSQGEALTWKGSTALAVTLR